MFPLWDVCVETLPGFSLVSSEFLEKAERSKAGIIVIGMRDIFAAETTGSGAGALKVTEEAACNLLFARETFFCRSGEPNENLPDRLSLFSMHLTGRLKSWERLPAGNGRKRAKLALLRLARSVRRLKKREGQTHSGRRT